MHGNPNNTKVVGVLFLLKMIDFRIKPFNELSTKELYALLELRSKVFVVEQNCVYQDVDGKDQKAIHVLGFKKETLVAYARVFKPGDYFEEASIGRVIVKKGERAFGYGHQLIAESNNYIFNTMDCKVIKISAQSYLEIFYNKHNYQKTGTPYLEDGIPHIAMVAKRD